MTTYVLRRILWLFPVLFFVATITFFLMHAVPGGPFDREVNRSKNVSRNLQIKYGLDQPVVVQYGRYLGNLAHGDFGVSFQFQDRSVLSVLREGMAPSAELGLLAFVYAVVIGTVLGAIAALRHNRLPDYASLLFATLGASVPSFVLAILLVLLLSVHWHILPVLGWGRWQQAILPTITLGSGSAAFIARITRASMLEVLQQDFVRTAMAKGLAIRVVVVRHIVKNAMIPLLTLFGPLAAGLITGSFIIEFIFVIPGIGRNFVQAIDARDYGMIMGTSLFYAFVIALANLVVDLLYGVVDPRIRYS